MATDRGSKVGPRRARGRLASNRARGENPNEPRAALSQSAPKQTGSSQPSRLILTSRHAHRIYIEGSQRATRVSLRNDPGIYRVAGYGAVKCHMRAMPTPSQTMDPDFTQMCPLASSPSASLEPSRQATLAQTLWLRETVDWVTHKTQPTPTKPNGA